MSEPKPHAPDGTRCWCGTDRAVYHYHCAEVGCGVDCTAGTEAGPPHGDVHGVTRCDEHHRAWEAREAKLRGVAHDLAERLEKSTAIMRNYAPRTWSEEIEANEDALRAAGRLP